MKSKYMALISIILLTVIACEKKEEPDFGFSTDINHASSGLVIKRVSKNADYIYLTGQIILDEGIIHVELERPDGTKAFNENISAPTDLKVREAFPAKPGYWSLRYHSERAKGIIDLYIHD